MTHYPRGIWTHNFLLLEDFATGAPMPHFARLHVDIPLSKDASKSVKEALDSGNVEEAKTLLFGAYAEAELEPDEVVKAMINGLPEAPIVVVEETDVSG